MGNKVHIKLIVLSVVFLVTCIFVYGYTAPAQSAKKTMLRAHFQTIEGYQNLGYSFLIDQHEDMLELDDYVFANYKGDQGTVNLYVGYYYSAGKAYAAHSPMVCYPSQGWKVDTKPTKHTLTVGPHDIHYEEIITSYGDEKELVLYWYQARLLTNTQVYQNKIDMGYNKLAHNDPQHGFVRVSVSMKNRSYAEAKAAATEFIQRFYPLLVAFVTEA